nr:MAG TPA: head to tail adaptor [Caudoviricetes sp.]
MLEKLRLSLRIRTNAFDTELQDLIAAALADLGLAGVTPPQADDPLVLRAVLTYARLHFGEPEDPARLKAAYDEQKAQLQMATGYTDWGDGLAEG